MTPEQREFVLNCMEDSLCDYFEAIEARVADQWMDEFGDDSWLEYRQALESVEVVVKYKEPGQ